MYMCTLFIYYYIIYMYQFTNTSTHLLIVLITLPSFVIVSDKRREFITNKYINKKFIEHQIDPSNLLNELCDAVEMRDIRYLLQV